MKCPVCMKENQKSSVHCLGSSVTLMYCAPYYDEDGEYHSHDINTRDTYYSCSNGHVWHVRGTDDCPNKKCGWVGKDPEIVIHEPDGAATTKP